MTDNKASELHRSQWFDPDELKKFKRQELMPPSRLGQLDMWERRYHAQVSLWIDDGLESDKQLSQEKALTKRVAVVLVSVILVLCVLLLGAWAAAS